MTPGPASVRYNDWCQVAVAPLQTFKPTLPVSVVIPSYQTSACVLARTLASLETQTYPRELFEVVIVDDGTAPPLECPPTSLNARVVRRPHRGGAASARNAGVRAAAHDIVLFLDSDMLVDGTWMAAHARWHHVVSDALTVGFRAHVATNGIEPDAIRQRSGALADLLAERPMDDTPGIEEYLAATNDLASRADDPFRMVSSASLGIGRRFFEHLGGMDETFVRWGLEDDELGYRAYIHGALLIPVRDALAWHQNRWQEGRGAKRRDAEIQRPKAAHLIAHRRYRGSAPGRFFVVPQFVVSIRACNKPADEVVAAVDTILADRVTDLVVRIETDPEEDDEGGERLARLREEFGPDPRVRVAPSGEALAAFPLSPFQVSLPARAYAKNIVARLRAELGDAVAATTEDGDVSIARTWALHRAFRTGKRAADFGEARTISARALKLAPATATARRWRRLRAHLGDVHGVGTAWAFLQRAGGAVWRRVAGD